MGKGVEDHPKCGKEGLKKRRRVAPCACLVKIQRGEPENTFALNEQW